MTASDLMRAQGACGLASRQHDSGFSATGRPAFVASAAAFSLLADGFRTASDFDDCMLASGMLMKDSRDPPASTSVAAVQPDPTRAEPAAPIPNAAARAPAALLAAEQPADAPMPSPVVTPAAYRTLAATRSIESAATWMRAQEVLEQGGRKSRDMYLVLCGAGDRSSCVMAAALGSKS